MENDKVKIIGTGVLKHYKEGKPYEVSQARLRTIPKNSYTLAEPEAPIFVVETPISKPPKNVVKPEEVPIPN